MYIDMDKQNHNTRFSMAYRGREGIRSFTGGTAGGGAAGGGSLLVRPVGKILYIPPIKMFPNNMAINLPTCFLLVPLVSSTHPPLRINDIIRPPVSTVNHQKVNFTNAV